MAKSASLRVRLLLLESALLAADLPQFLLAFSKFFILTDTVPALFFCRIAYLDVARFGPIPQRSIKFSVPANPTI